MPIIISCMWYSTDSQNSLETSLNEAVSQRNVTRLKIILEDPNLQLGVIDDTKANLYLETLSSSESSGQNLDLDHIFIEIKG